MLSIEVREKTEPILAQREGQGTISGLVQHAKLPDGKALI